MRGIKISSRYAKSLVDLCIERNQLNAAYADMQLVLSTIQSSKDLSNLLNSPVIKPDTKVAALNKLFGGEIGEVTHGFIKLLTEKGREGYLAEVAESFLEQVKTHNNIVTAVVTTAVPLDDHTRSEILKIAGKLRSGEIDLVEKIDESVIGGFVLKVGDKMVDSSIAGKLRAIKREFDDNPYIAEL